MVKAQDRVLVSKRGVIGHHQAPPPFTESSEVNLLGTNAVSYSQEPMPWLVERSVIGLQKHKSDLMAPLLKNF